MAESWPKKFRVERQTGAGTRQDELPKVYPYYRASHHHKFLIGKLERVEAGEQPRTMVSMPLQHGKAGEANEASARLAYCAQRITTE
jgi:hypothetical protein